MNKVFKVVLNKKNGTWVAVDEFFRGFSKNTSVVKTVSTAILSTCLATAANAEIFTQNLVEAPTNGLTGVDITTLHKTSLPDFDNKYLDTYIGLWATNSLSGSGDFKVNVNSQVVSESALNGVRVNGTTNNQNNGSILWQGNANIFASSTAGGLANTFGLYIDDQGKVEGSGGNLTVSAEGRTDATTIEILHGSSFKWTGDVKTSSVLNGIAATSQDNSAVGVSVEFQEQDGHTGSAELLGNVDITAIVKVVENKDPKESFAATGVYASPFDGDKVATSEETQKASVVLGGQDKSVVLKAQLLNNTNEESMAAGVYSEGANVQLSGQTVTINASSDQLGTVSGILSDLGGIVKGNGNLTLEAQGSDVSGIKIGKESKVNWTGDVSVSSSKNSFSSGIGKTFGFYLADQGNFEGSGQNLNLTLQGISDATAIEVTKGSSFKWTGDTKVTSVLLGRGLEHEDNSAIGVSVEFQEQDGHQGSVELAGNVYVDATVQVEENHNENEEFNASGIYASPFDGDKDSSSEDLNKAKVVVGGAGNTVSLKAQLVNNSNDGSLAAGIYSEGASVQVTGNTVAIKAATDKAGVAAGVITSFGGVVDILGNDINISADGQGSSQAYALKGEQGIGEHDNGTGNPVITQSSASSTINVGNADNKGKVVLSAVSQAGEAYAVRVVQGSVNLFGDVTIGAGKIFVQNDSKSDLNIHGNLNLSTLDTFVENTKAVNILKDGKVTTVSSVVFENAASETQTAAGSILYGKFLNFQDGSSLILTDAKYTSDYLKNIRALVSGTPTIKMTGEQVDGQLKVEDLKDIPNTEQPNTTLVADSNTVLNDTNLPSSVGVGSVDLGQGNNLTVQTTGSQNFGIIGGKGGELVSGKGPVTVTAQNDTKLTFGGQGTVGGSLNGTVSAEGNSTVTFSGTGEAGSDPVFNVSDSVQAKGNSKVIITNYTTVQTGSFNVEAGASVYVGESTNTGVGTLVADKFALSGNLLMDPVWLDGGKSSQGAFGELQMNSGSQLIVGQNSMLVVGSKDVGLAQQALDKSGHKLAENDVQAILYVAKPLNVANGSILVDGTVNSLPTSLDAGVVNVAPASMLAVKLDNSTAVGDSVVFTGASVTLDEGSRLYLDLADVSVKEDLAVKLADTVNANIQNGNISGSSGLWYGYQFRDGVLTAQYDPTSVLVQAGLIAPNVTREALQTNAEAASGLRELIDAGDYAGAARWMNKRALFASAGAAQAMAVTTASMVTDTIVRHGSLISSYNHDKSGADLWINVNGLFSKANSYEAGSASYGYRADLAGITFGADYAFGNGAAAGAAVSLGKGSARSRGEASGIKNKIEYWGVNLYGTWNTPYANVIGTLGYIQSQNDLKATALKAKPDTKAFTAAVRVEKEFKVNDAFAVTPHIGARYTHLKLDDFSAGGFKYSAEKANLFQIPVGVAVSGNYEASCGAKVKPFVDVSVSPTMGDRKVSNRFALAETSASDSIETRIANTALFNAKVGLQATKGAHSFGLNYGVGAGNKGRVDQALQAQYRYSF